MNNAIDKYLELARKYYAKNLDKDERDEALEDWKNYEQAMEVIFPKETEILENIVTLVCLYKNDVIIKALELILDVDNCPLLKSR